MAEVRNRRRGFTRITSKHQATIPVHALREAGLSTGDEVRVTALGPGRILLQRQGDVVDRLAGSLPGIWKPGDLERQRDEWEQ